MGDPGFVSLPQGTIARSQGQQQQQQQQQQQHQHPQHHLTSHQCSPSPVVRNTHSGHMGSFQPQSINSTPHPPPHHHHPQQPPQQRHSEMPQSSSPPHIAHPVSHQNSSSFSPNSLPGNISRRMTQSEAREALTTYLIYRLYQTDNAKWESTRNTGVLSDHQAARDMQALGRDDGIKLRDRLNKLNGLQRRCLEKRLKKMREREMRDPSEGGSYKIDLVGVEELSLKGENIKWKRGEVEVEVRDRGRGRGRGQRYDRERSSGKGKKSVKHHGHWYRVEGKVGGGKKRLERHKHKHKDKAERRGEETRGRTVPVPETSYIVAYYRRSPKSGVDAVALYRGLAEEPRRRSHEGIIQLHGGNTHHQQPRLGPPLLPHQPHHLHHPVLQSQQQHQHLAPSPPQHQQQHSHQPHSLQQQPLHPQHQQFHPVPQHGSNLGLPGWGPPSGPGGPGGPYPPHAVNPSCPALPAGWPPRPPTGPSTQHITIHHSSNQLPLNTQHQQHPNMVRIVSSSGSGSFNSSSPTTIFSRARESGSESDTETDYSDSESESESACESESNSENGQQGGHRYHSRSHSLGLKKSGTRGRSRHAGADSRGSSRSSSRSRSRSRIRTRSKPRRRHHSHAKPQRASHNRQRRRQPRPHSGLRSRSQSQSESQSRSRSQSHSRSRRASSHFRRSRSRSRSYSCSKCQSQSPDYNRHSHSHSRNHGHQHRQADSDAVLLSNRLQNLQISSTKNSEYETAGSYRYLPADKGKRWSGPLASDEDYDYGGRPEPEVIGVRRLVADPGGHGGRGGLSIRGRRNDDGWGVEERPRDSDDDGGARTERMYFPLGNREATRNPFYPLPLPKGFPGR